MYKRILVPLDGSGLAKSILPQVVDLAKCHEAEVTLITVGTISDVAHLAEMAPSVVTDTMGALKRASEKNLKEAMNELQAKGLKASWVYQTGIPAQEIVQYAAKAPCDLIAMATHGSGEAAWVLGSVAEKVASHATVPVLLMRVIEAQPIIEKGQLPGGP